MFSDVRHNSAYSTALVLPTIHLVNMVGYSNCAYSLSVCFCYLCGCPCRKNPISFLYSLLVLHSVSWQAHHASSWNCKARCIIRKLLFVASAMFRGIFSRGSFFFLYLRSAIRIVSYTDSFGFIRNFIPGEACDYIVQEQAEAVGVACSRVGIKQESDFERIRAM